MGWIRLWMVAMIALASAMATGCGDDGASDGNSGDGDGDSGDGDGDSGDGDGDSGNAQQVELIPCDASVCFQEVYDAVLHNTATYSCDDAFCHGRGAGELWMIDKQTTYEALVTVPAAGEAPNDTATACADSGLVRVVPGDPDASLLLEKIAEAEPSCGAPMPQNPDQTVTTEHVELVRTWIADGAGYE